MDWRGSMRRGRGACWDCSGVLGWIVGEDERGGFRLERHERVWVVVNEWQDEVGQLCSNNIPADQIWMTCWRLQRTGWAGFLHVAWRYAEFGLLKGETGSPVCDGSLHISVNSVWVSASNLSVRRNQHVVNKTNSCWNPWSFGEVFLPNETPTCWFYLALTDQYTCFNCYIRKHKTCCQLKSPLIRRKH